MCFHWQQGCADRLYEEFKVKTDQEIVAELYNRRRLAEKTYSDAIAYHGSEENFTGFFAGQIYSRKLDISALELILSRRGASIAN